jgi:hypothetical protein
VVWSILCGFAGNARKTMVAKTKTAPRGMSIGSFDCRKFEKNQKFTKKSKKKLAILDGTVIVNNVNMVFSF